MKTTLIPFSESRKPADVFFIGLFEKGQLAKEIELLEPAFARAMASAVRKEKFEAKTDQVFSFCHEENHEAFEIVLLGLGDKKKYKASSCRTAAGSLARLAKEKKASQVRVCADSFSGGAVGLKDLVANLTQTVLLAVYDFDKYKSKKDNGNKPPKKIDGLDILVSSKQNLPVLQKAVDTARILAEGTLWARDIVNEPGNVINPQTLAEKARELARKKKISCKVLGREELSQLKMNGILAVNQGSVTGPALIILEYGVQHKKRGTICLVGKGVTFDTGGISIKPSKDMEKMKYDMAGAAAVIAAAGVAADLKLQRHIVALVPAAENMVAENPQRPGDIITLSNGKSVEVINTDAEGRLILADALAYSARYEPKAVIDIATLTGMCAYTFGDKAIGMLGNDERLLAQVRQAGEETGERCWPLPLWEDYAKQIKGHHSDLLNTGGSYAGTITAAMFLKEFVPEKTAWVHLDIAGTAWCDSPRFDCCKGATGVGVRLLAGFLSARK